MGRSDKKFENQWRDVFDGTEVAPSDKIWSKIQLSLSESQNALYAQKIKRTRWLTAAAISLILTAGALGYYYGSTSQFDVQNLISTSEEPLLRKDDSADSKALNTTPDKDVLNIDKNSDVPTLEEAQLATQQSSTDIPESINLNAKKDKLENMGRNNGNTLLPASQNAKSVINALTLNTDDVSSIKNKLLVDENTTTFPGSALLLSKLKPRNVILPAKLDKVKLENFPYARPIFKSNDEIENNNLWGGISFAGGNFNPEGYTAIGNSKNDQEVYALAPDIESTQTVNYYSSKVPGTSRLIALNIGKRIGNRWAISSGISLDNFVSGIEVSQSDFSQFSRIQDAELTSFQSPQMSDVYVQQNTSNYITLPFQVDYYVIDKRIGWAITSGVSSSALIGFKEERLSDNHLSFIINEQENNRLLFWYVIGTEFNYALGEHYAVALAPGYRLALNSQEGNSDKRATSAELGFRFKYNF